MLPMVSRQRYELDRLRTALQAFVVVVLDLQRERPPRRGIGLHRRDLGGRNVDRPGPHAGKIAANHRGLWGAGHQKAARQAKQD